jgi:hypothetical protein
VSSVGNSGVKFGKVAGSDFEVNILDVQSMGQNRVRTVFQRIEQMYVQTNRA